MRQQRIGIIMHGVTGRMGMNQHLIRSVLAIRDQGGMALADGSYLVPDPIIVGRNADKIEALAKAHGVERFTTDLDAALANPDDTIFFDAASTQMRPGLLKKAIDAGEIGAVLQATFRLRPGDGQGPRAYLDRQPYFQQMERFLIHETGVHWIDVFRFLLGNPTAVYADLRQRNPVIKGEDAGVVVFDHPGEVRAIFDGNRHLDHAADNLRRTMGEALIEGSKGSLTLTGDGAVHLRGFQSDVSQQLLPPDTFDGFGGDCVHALQSHVIHALRTGTPPENTADAYLAVVEIEAAIYTSAHDARKIRLDLS